MPNYYQYNDQIITSTNVDSHGEKRPREFFERLIDSAPPKIPLGQQHDMKNETVGYLENLRLVPDKINDTEWNLIANVFITSDNLDEALRGFSYSVLETIGGNTSNPVYYIHIPYPMYNDDNFIEELINEEERLLVGRWVKKALDPLTIGLIATGVVFILGPEWDIQYKQNLRPKIERLFKFIPQLLKKGISPDFIQHVTGNMGEKIQIYFVPDRSNIYESYDTELLFLALQKTKNFLDNDFKSNHIGVERIKFYFDKDIKRYKLFHVQYLNGEDINIV